MPVRRAAALVHRDAALPLGLLGRGGATAWQRREFHDRWENRVGLAAVYHDEGSGASRGRHGPGSGRPSHEGEESLPRYQGVLLRVIGGSALRLVPHAPRAHGL